MTIPRTNLTHPSDRKKNPLPDSPLLQKRRLSDIQTDLRKVVDPFDTREALEDRGPWDKAYSEMAYAPYERLQQMTRDAAKSAAENLSLDKQDQVRKAIKRLYQTLLEDALEFLGEESEEELLTLAVESQREIGEANSALVTAISSRQPRDFSTAAREQSDVLSVAAKLRDECLEKARDAFITPRTVALFKSAR